MSRFTLLAGAFSFVFSQLATAVPVIVHPGTANDIVITHNNTINGTTPAGQQYAAQSEPSSYLDLSLINYLNSNNVKGYITGLDSNGQLAFVGTNGQFYYPSTSSSTPQPIPNSAIALSLGGKGSSTSATIPGYLGSSRVYFSEGDLQFFVVATGGGNVGLVEPAAVNPNDPNAGVNYGFVELNWAQNSGIFADVSFVDFAGLPLGIELTTTDGSPEQQALGLTSNAVSGICNDLKNQGNNDGQPWGDLCVYDSSGNLIRVLAPIDYISQNSNAFSGYFNNYIDQVLQHYSSNTLTIDTQAAAGDVSCYADTNSQTISCDGANRDFGFPSSEDIFGCNSGPFAFQSGDNAEVYAIVPRLCAAYNRATYLINGGNVQPGPAPSDYYSVSPNNYYSKFVHQYEWHGLGYAFSYDDVSPNGENVAGTVSSQNPGTFTILVGGYDLA